MNNKIIEELFLSDNQQDVKLAVIMTVKEENTSNAFPYHHDGWMRNRYKPRPKDVVSNRDWFSYIVTYKNKTYYFAINNSFVIYTRDKSSVEWCKGARNKEIITL